MTSLSAHLRVSTRAFPALLRVGAAEAFAYRAELIVWMLTTTLPLVMLGLWTSVAAEGPFANYSSDDFIAYYLLALMVRNLTGNWVVWQINDEVRRGVLTLRLLHPIHPFVSYAAAHLAAIPIRALIVLPAAAILVAVITPAQLATDPWIYAVLPLAILGAWALTFFVFIMLGALCFFVEKSLSLFDIYMGVFAVFSGYLVPLELLPGVLRDIGVFLPFRFMLAFPVELATGRYGLLAAIDGLLLQWGFVAGSFTAALLLWRAGIRRFEAYGA